VPPLVVHKTKQHPPPRRVTLHAPEPLLSTPEYPELAAFRPDPPGLESAALGLCSEPHHILGQCSERLPLPQVAFAPQEMIIQVWPRSSSQMCGSRGASRVPAQMWAAASAVPAQMWAGASAVPAQMWAVASAVPAQSVVRIH
jgi:hypothetical protein